MKKYLIAGLALATLLASCNSNEWDVTSDLSVDKEDPTIGLTPLAEQEGTVKDVRQLGKLINKP